MKGIFDRSVGLRDISGQRIPLGPSEMIFLLRQDATKLYLLCVYALLVATDAPGLGGSVNPGTMMAIWAVIMGAYIAGLWMVLTILAAVQARLGTWDTPSPLISAASLVPAMAAGEGLTHAATQGAMDFPVLPQVFYYFVIAEVFGLLFLRFVRPLIESATAETARKIVIGAEPVMLARVRLIEAREHHVHVTLDGTTLTHRARLGDIIAQTAPDDGIQPHRSWWVSAQAAHHIERDGQKHVLCLDDGTRVPVARSRVEEVRDWLARQG